jgi:hypothetical protein
MGTYVVPSYEVRGFGGFGYAYVHVWLVYP